jgi:hypothetical protein
MNIFDQFLLLAASEQEKTGADNEKVHKLVE